MKHTVQRHDSSHYMCLTKRTCKNRRNVARIIWWTHNPVLAIIQFHCTPRGNTRCEARSVCLPCNCACQCHKQNSACLSLQPVFTKVSFLVYLKQHLVLCRNVITNWIFKISRRVCVGNTFNLHEGTIPELLGKNRQKTVRNGRSLPEPVTKHLCTVLQPTTINMD